MSEGQSIGTLEEHRLRRKDTSFDAPLQQPVDSQDAGLLKELEMYPASAAWEDLVYNFARPLKTLRVEIHDDPKRRWKPRTPAMVVGLTDHIWTVKELLTTVVPPNNT